MKDETNQSHFHHCCPFGGRAPTDRWRRATARAGGAQHCQCHFFHCFETFFKVIVHLPRAERKERAVFEKAGYFYHLQRAAHMNVVSVCTYLTTINGLLWLF